MENNLLLNHSRFKLLMGHVRLLSDGSQVETRYREAAARLVLGLARLGSFRDVAEQLSLNLQLLSLHRLYIFVSHKWIGSTFIVI